ncbi:uncharacterized protein YkwD [Salsuginibacillus halophilus]|uniref:Uncharacterized protein YkwD n=1 Tax=Salsuginibacillus halophilus TaxID=517424 RepID=A0A2P8HX96_9BACI|nr:CAP-associated domain-containing protein [Salsuginibacillus halophilus]PSL50818.1 uncharacterized protein YkwD [Salsuginibacillus halophilus]
MFLKSLFAFFVFSGLLALGIFSYYAFIYETPEEEEHWDIDEIIENEQEIDTSEENDSLDEDEETVDVPENRSSLNEWMGQSRQDLIEVWGPPGHEGPSAYGYDWLLYEGEGGVFAFGVEDETIVTAAGTEQMNSTNEVFLHDDRQTVEDSWTFENELSVDTEQGSYTFDVSGDHHETRPVAEIDEDLYVQAYFDVHENQLTAVRYMSPDVLVRHQPFPVTYTGDLPDQKPEARANWEDVEAIDAEAIHAYNNAIRKQHGLAPLSWHEQAATAATAHSRHMVEENYFAHTAPDGTGLGERLQEQNVDLLMAGENIAAEHTDALAAAIGWLNSEGHRENVLHEEFTHHGSGVFERTYTQNFVRPASEGSPHTP